MICGGSHFLRRDCFNDPVYFPNKYGYEELPPSLYALDHGFVLGLCPSLLVIHKPAVNKWDFKQIANRELLITELAIPCAIKQMMYPSIFMPMLNIANRKRIRKHGLDKKEERQVKTLIQSITTECPVRERIKIQTVLKMYHEFGLSIF